MDNEKHGVTVGMERVGDEAFMSLKATGRLTHADYQTLIPVIEGALAQVHGPHVRALFDLTEFKGWELQAAWDDLKLSLKHGAKFSKVALYGHKNWHERVAKVANWFVDGEVQFFDDPEQATSWLSMKD